MTPSHPKILADSYQMTVMVFERTRNFPKHYRPTLGRRLEDRTIDLTSVIRVASLAPKSRAQDSRRTTALDHASQILDEIRILLQLSHDMHIITSNAYGELSELTASIGRQIGGFAKTESLV